MRSFDGAESVKLAAVVSVVMVAAVTCADRAGPPQSEAERERGGLPSVDQGGTASSSIPDDLDIAIISQDVVEGVRRSLDVRISRPVDETVLEELAHELRDEESRDFPRTFIIYYLPGMEVDAGGWATSHFNPELEVRILGLPADSQSGSDGLSAEYGDALVGAWEDNRPVVASRYVLLNEEGRLFFDQVFRDGSSRRFVVVESPSPLGRRLENPSNQFGEYFLIRDGQLEMWDPEGIIFSASPVDR